jgi:hypothetical protein
LRHILLLFFLSWVYCNFIKRTLHLVSAAVSKFGRGRIVEPLVPVVNVVFSSVNF